MKLSTKSEYAFLALIELAVNYESGYTKITDITSKRNIPKKYLEQIMMVLKSAGYVKTRLGPAGGYMLGKAPEKISMADIIRLLDGALAPVLSVSEYFYEPSPIEQSPELVSVFMDIRAYVAGVMERTTLKDLIPKRVR